MVTLWRLATNIEFRTLGPLFGIARGTACVISSPDPKGGSGELLPSLGVRRTS